jgi:D-alanine--poly(phosphoribitol) ligase subunit 1
VNTLAGNSFLADIRTDDAPAIITRDGVLTYAGLAERIERLAAVLVNRGVGPERVCAVAVEHGVEAIVAMAAVVRAGGAFLTVDVDLPAQRLGFMLDGADFVVAKEAGRFGPPTILLDETCDEPLAPQAVNARSLAYISHTSGSTGTPNAVMIERHGLESYLRFVVRDYGLGPETVALQLAPLGYDASIRDTFAPLLAGGRLVVLPRSALLRPEELFDALRVFEVDTILSVTPSFLTFLAQQHNAVERLRGLRLVVSSGESMRPLLAAGGRRMINGRLVNQYGPTECTMTSTRFDVPDLPGTRDLVGTPIDGVSVHLVDGELRPVPEGGVGEVHIGGIGVARGYRGRPGLTAERFVPDPFGPPGSRMYRTGDLAKRHDGVLEYFGRVDRQVKIRGYRVDPAEIEGALLTHPAVTGAAVTTSADGQGRVFLVAHVTGDLTGVEDRVLRAHLAATLPPYMMPRRFARIEQLPKTRSGKVDRLALSTAGSR